MNMRTYIEQSPAESEALTGKGFGEQPDFQRVYQKSQTPNLRRRLSADRDSFDGGFKGRVLIRNGASAALGYTLARWPTFKAVSHERQPHAGEDLRKASRMPSRACAGAFGGDDNRREVVAPPTIRHRGLVTNRENSRWNAGEDTDNALLAFTQILSLRRCFNQFDRRWVASSMVERWDVAPKMGVQFLRLPPTQTRPGGSGNTNTSNACSTSRSAPVKSSRSWYRDGGTHNLGAADHLHPRPVKSDRIERPQKDLRFVGKNEYLNLSMRQTGKQGSFTGESGLAVRIYA